MRHCFICSLFGFHGGSVRGRSRWRFLFFLVLSLLLGSVSDLWLSFFLLLIILIVFSGLFVLCLFGFFCLVLVFVNYFDIIGYLFLVIDLSYIICSSYVVNVFVIVFMVLRCIKNGVLDLTVDCVTYRLVLLILRLFGWLFCRVCHELSLHFNCVHHLDGGSLPTRRLGVNFQHTIAANLLHLTVNANFAFTASIADSMFL